MSAKKLTRLVQPSEIKPDVKALPAFKAEDDGAKEAAAASEYRELQPEQAQCLAAANSTLGNLLSTESSIAMSTGTDRRGTPGPEAPTKRDVLACRAVDERNRSAATALRLFYSLAEAEANRAWLDKSLAEAKRAVDNLEKVKEQGLLVPAEGRLFEQQRVGLLDQDAQLRNSVDQLNGQLRALVGLDDDRTPLWPAADLDVTGEPIDVEEAVRVGLANRPDLAMLRAMGASLDTETLPAARSGLQQVDPLLGSSGQTARFLSRRSKEKSDATELPSRRGQLSQLQTDRRRAAVEEIGQKARTVDTRVRQVVLAEEARKLRQQQLDRLTKKRAADGVTAFELSKARLELFRAESDLVSKAAAWKIAQVELKESQGLLAKECGYCLPASCGGTCK
jgi:outer membrane protein TolC